MAARAQGRPATHAEAGQAHGNVPVAPHGLVDGPGGVPGGMRLAAVPAPVAVVDDMDGDPLGPARAAEAASQRAYGGGRHQGDGLRLETGSPPGSSSTTPPAALGSGPSALPNRAP